MHSNVGNNIESACTWKFLLVCRLVLVGLMSILHIEKGRKHHSRSDLTSVVTDESALRNSHKITSTSTVTLQGTSKLNILPTVCNTYLYC